jgi:hypothetical protein
MELFEAVKGRTSGDGEFSTRMEKAKGRFVHV